MLTLTSALLGASTAMEAAGTARSMLFASVPKFSPPPPSSPTLAPPPSPIELTCPADIDAEIMKIYRGGQYDACPAESFYYKHHPDVYDGYEGCVGENGLHPCGQDGFGGADGVTTYNKQFAYQNGQCVDTGYTMETMSYWIMWGHPMDKKELLKRTGLNPVISFPFVRGPYPSYGFSPNSDGDEADLWPVHQEWLYYLGWPEGDLDHYGAYPTEGAEQSMDLLYAAKALELASTSCTRRMYILAEAPAYGYDIAQAARWANTRSNEFYSGPECECFPDCNEPTLTIAPIVGHVVGDPFPEAVGGDGVTYAADSTETNSPWIETMVFPENPTGKVKTPLLTVERRVCDGVYVYPMYFGANNWTVPSDLIPDCSGWAYSITKVYSAAFRAGIVTYKKDQPAFATALGRMASRAASGANGIYSDMAWMGYIQFMQLAMNSGAVDSPSSWIGAYKTIQEEKWSALIDAQADCPFMRVTNPNAGAYSFWAAKEPAFGLDLYTFFWDSLGVEVPGYGYSFRGADPAAIYGEGLTTDDFVRMQLYRDVNVYLEVARRIGITCGDLDAAVPGFLSFNEWKAERESARRRRLNDKEMSHEEQFASVKAVAPRLTDDEAHRMAANRVRRNLLAQRVNTECAKDGFAQSCVMEVYGRNGNDTPVKQGGKQAYVARKKTVQRRKMTHQERIKLLSEHSVHPKRALFGTEIEATQTLSDYSLATLDACTMKEANGGQFEICPPESFYWEHHPSVFGGYTGCVGENLLIPCGQDGFGGLSGMVTYQKPIIWNPETQTCEDTGYTPQTQLYWIRSGHPMDKYELIKRTGLNPVIKFPFVRGPYPSYSWGDEHGADEADLWPVMKDFLVYLGAHTEAQLEEFNGYPTEGAEQSMDLLFAAKALEFALTSCTRHFYIFTEAPGYGYDFAQAATWANTQASNFYANETCTCWPNCNEPTIEFTQVGWFPGTPFPSAPGGDGENYVATSSNYNSPWIETLVMPENPSGAIKIAQLPTYKRVCDGVYVYPMYFGHRNWRVPINEMQDCSGWAYSITKVYSAAFRAGLVSYRLDQPNFADAMTRMASLAGSGANGQVSDMTWMGYIEFMRLVMASGPIDSPTSWIGAYVEIMKEKYGALTDATTNCPFMELTNPGGGAYSFWIAKPPMYGLDLVDYFWEGFGVSAFSYNWGFRGADPADYYGPGVTINDFTRMQLYRDINVYHEVARRMQLACSGSAAEGFLTFDEYVASKTARRARKLSDGAMSREEHIADVKAVAAHLTDKQAARIADMRLNRDRFSRRISTECAAENFASSCIMNIEAEEKPAFEAI